MERLDWTQTRPGDVGGWYLYTREGFHDERAVPLHARYILAYYDGGGLVHSNGEKRLLSDFQGTMYWLGPLPEPEFEQFHNTPAQRQPVERDAQDRQALAHQERDRLAQQSVNEDKKTLGAQHDAAIESHEEKGRENERQRKDQRRS